MQRQVPKAIIQGASVSRLEPGAPLRKWLVATGVVAAAFVTWRLVTCRPAVVPDPAHDLLVDRLDHARALVGHGLDAAFDRIDSTGNTRIGFTTTLDIATPEAGDDCRRGFADAFAKIIHPDALTLVPEPFAPRDLNIDLRATLSSAGLRGYVTWLGARVTIAEPQADLRAACSRIADRLIAALTTRS